MMIMVDDRKACVVWIQPVDCPFKAKTKFNLVLAVTSSFDASWYSVAQQLQ